MALGVAYRGDHYHGWQSQPSGRTVQDRLEAALGEFAAMPVATLCAGRTDTGVHGLNQVVHFDTPLSRPEFSWVRGTNRYLPKDIAVQWCKPVDARFHARNSARGRRYRYLLLESPVRPAVEQGGCGWVFRPLDGDAMREAAAETLMKLQDAANAARMASEESQAAADRHTAQIEKRLSALASTAGAKKAAPAQQAPRHLQNIV